MNDISSGGVTSPESSLSDLTGTGRTGLPAAADVTISVSAPDRVFDEVGYSVDMASGDVVLPYTMPQAEYMYGCVATSVGMLLGYYDLYGCRVGSVTYDMSNIIPGTISVYSRGSDDGSIYDMDDPSLLAQFIASEEYAGRFYDTTPADELYWTYVDGDPAKGLNVSVWNCLADYLGTGQYWRGNGDLSTSHYYATLDWLNKTSQTVTEGSLVVPVKYEDFKYGLSLYLSSVGYTLDPNRTESFEISDFSFSDFRAEIDAGRPVLVSMKAGSSGHMVLAYGYNISTQEIIFDDTYRSDCRMSWTGTYLYNKKNFSLSGVTTVVFDTAGLPVSSGGSTPHEEVITGAVISGSVVVHSAVQYVCPSVIGGGRLTVSGGGLTTSAKVSSGGRLVVHSSGVVDSTVVSSGGNMYVSSGGTATSTTVHSGGSVGISSGGTANDVTVSGGSVYVAPRGTVSRTILRGAGSMNVASGGKVDSVTVGSGAKLAVSGGGSALQIRESGGYVSPGVNAVVTFVANSFSDLYLTSASATVHSGTTAGNGVLRSLGSMYVYSGGTAAATTVSAGGHICIFSGGAANRTTVSSGGTQYLSGGTANSATVSSGGRMYVSGSAVVSGVSVISGGTLTFLGGAVVSGSQVYGGTVVLNGSVTAGGADVTFSIDRRTAADTRIVNDLALLDARAYSITVSTAQAAGTYVLADGAAGFNRTVTVCTTSSICKSITVGNSVSIGDRVFTLDLAGTSLRLSVASSAAPPVSSGTTAVRTYSGSVPVSSAGVMTGKTLVSGGGETIMRISSGGRAETVTVRSGGSLFVSNGGSADGTVVSSGGSLYVSSGAVVTDTTVSSFGSMYVCGGGSAADTVISGGSVFILSGGTADDVSVAAGAKLFVSGGGSALRIRENGGYVSLGVGASAEFAANVFHGVSLLSASATLHSGTTAGESVLNALGYMYVSNGGTASGTTIAANGRLYVSSGGTAKGVTVASSGTLNIYDGGKLSGPLLISAGATVSALTGSIIDFDVTSVAPGGPALVNNLAYIGGTPGYTITVSSTQANGTYKLADGAAGFKKTVTICTTANVCGSLAVGNTVTLSGRDYSLSLNSGTLSLTVAGGPVSAPPGDLDGDGRADVVMTITQSGHGAEGATGAWLIQNGQTAAWGDLSQRNTGWEIFGMGVTDAGKTTNDVYVKNTGNIIGAWVTDDSGHVAGWETIGQFDAATRILGLGDFNADGQTDLLLRNVNGAVGCYFTSGEILGWNYFQSLGDEWKLTAVGDLNGDGRDDVVLKHDAGFAGSWLTQSDGTMVWANLDTLPDGFAVAGAGDFDGDGVDDVLLKKGTYYGAWLVENGSVKSWFGLGDLGSVAVEQIADFDGDGRDDLRIRTSAGDIGVQLVKGADTLEWHYYGSVGAEWTTRLAAI